MVDVNDTAYKEELLDRYNNSPDKAMPTSFVKKRIDHPLYLANFASRQWEKQTEH